MTPSGASSDKIPERHLCRLVRDPRCDRRLSREWWGGKWTTRGLLQVHLLTLWRILRKPTVEKRSASQGEGEPADGHEMSTAEIAQEAGTSWTRVGPLRFPAWTSAGLLAAIPMLLLATAVAGFVA